MVFEKAVKVGKTERYEFGLGAWLDGETLTSATATACGVAGTLSQVVIQGSDIGFFVTGSAKGKLGVILEYATATRTDSIKLTVIVLDSDSC